MSSYDRIGLMNLVHEAIKEGLDRECDDTGQGALCQHIGDWLYEAGIRLPRDPDDAVLLHPMPEGPSTAEAEQ